MIAIRSLTLPLFVLVAAMAGCNGEADTSTQTESVDDVSTTIATESSAEGKSQRAGRPFRGGHKGPDFLVHAALRAPIDLTAEQRKTIEGLLENQAPRDRRLDSARASKLAAAIRSNSVDESLAARHDERRDAHIAASTKALATLHATLTPEQRATLVESIRDRSKGDKGDAKLGARGAKFGKHAGRIEKSEKGDRFARARGGANAGPMFLLEGLELTQEQKDTLRAKLGSERPAKPSAEHREAMKTKFESMRAERLAKLESFKSDSFDAKAFVTPNANLPTAHVDRHAKQLAAIASVLTAEQRETLASRIEKGDAKFAERGDKMRLRMDRAAK